MSLRQSSLGQSRWRDPGRIVQRLPSSYTVDIDTPFKNGRAKVLCIENPAQKVSFGNIRGGPGLRQHSEECKGR